MTPTRNPLLLCLALLTLFPGSVALASPASAIRNPLLWLVDDFVRGSLQSTPEWHVIRTRRNQIRSAGPGSGLEMGLLDREVMAQLREIQEIVEARRRLNPSTARTSSEAELVRLLARSRLQMTDDFADLSRGIDEVLGAERFDLIGLNRAAIRTSLHSEIRFLRSRPAQHPAFNLQGPRGVSEAEYLAAQAAANRARPPISRLSSQARQARTWFDRMDHCVRTSPRQEQTDRRRFFFLTDLSQSLSITAFGFIAGAGEHEVDWSYLPVDLALTVFDKFISQRISFRDSPLRVRYLYATLYNEFRVAVDLGIFMIWPREDSEMTPEQRLDLGMTRTEWGTVWNAMTTWTSVGVSTILGGLECFSPTPGTRFFVSSIRLGNSLARSYAFYHGREDYIDWRLNRD